MIQTKHGNINLPAFMPDATYGSIKAASFKDVEKTGTEAIVTTTLHIEQKIGSLYIKEFGGLHKFFGWNKPILTDSGGWQVFSLIQSKADKGKNKITDLGCSFVNPNTGEHSLLTPESSQVIQHNLGADIVTVLDDPILGDASYAQRKECIRINTLWAKRSKKKFDELNSHLKVKPLIGAVIQGGNDTELRKISAEELLELDFDIYNFGGMPLHTGITWLTDSKKGFYHEMLEYVSSLIPNTKLKYAMGIGQPDDIAFCVDVGWDLFDTVLPTRNARHGLIYVSEGQGEETKKYKSFGYDTLHLKTERYKFDDKPIDEKCSCEACSTVSRAYLRHLIRIGEASGLRLATIHNLQFYADWMSQIRQSS
ncbi:MAG: tRNA guanosine(34) transglycosylase Tgt [Ignavibacteriaceae bacterium]|nr:tRNA guanosine(34) transglycosylase Tgt [Ignavibacteriaceae bacterium]